MIELLLATQLTLSQWDKLSTGLVISQISIDTIDSLKKPNRSKAIKCQTEKILLTVALAELTKSLVHRRRPDGSDNKSFYSEHTALTVVSTFSYWQIPLSFGVGLGRVQAHKHYRTDVLAGSAIGLATSFICSK